MAKASYCKELLKTCGSTESWKFVNEILRKNGQLILYHTVKYYWKIAN